VNSERSIILLVDDDEKATEVLTRALQRRDKALSILNAKNREQALSYISKECIDAVVVDLSLDPARGPESGLELISEILSNDPAIRILVLTGHGADDYGIEAVQRGAGSFIEKPADSDHLHALLVDAVRCTKIKRGYLRLQYTPENLSRLTGLESRNSAMVNVIEQVAYAASNKQAVLLIGETGTGKGVLARAIHSASQRHAEPFIRFQTSFGSADLVASELFGHQRGSFTGASADRRGLLEEAHRGTLFLDEVDQLPQETQVLLLNTLQEKVFRRVGSNKEIKSDFRLITASNRPMDQLLGENGLREDFYHRIAHSKIVIPPLRDRREDIEPLSRGFIERLASNENLPVRDISQEAISRLTGHAWPGNIRELQACVEGAVYSANYNGRKTLTEADLRLSSEKRETSIAPLCFRERVNSFEFQLVQDALRRCDNNQSKAAQLLQMDRTSLRRILSRNNP
jgi:DNA-binding NtrC family response regulator